MKNIVIIGGGTGTFTLLKGLREFPTNNSVIVSTADDGGSTGRLRKDYGVLPPGDLRQCLVGLSYTDEALKNMFNFRFEKGELRGHALGNLILTALAKSTGSMENALIVAARMLNVRGQIVPVTNYPTVLSAKLANGKIIVGEHELDEPKKKQKIEIKSISVKPSAPANPRALKVLIDANAIVFGPGDLYTSTLPNLAVKGVSEVINKSKAKKVLVINIMNKPGQTEGFKASDHVNVVSKFVKLDAVVVNSKEPSPALLMSYKRRGSKPVEVDKEALIKMGMVVYTGQLVGKKVSEQDSNDMLTRSVLRHDSKELAKIIFEIIK